MDGQIVWAITDGKEFASVRIPVGDGKLVNVPLIFQSREKARIVMKAYPELASKKNTIRKMRNGMVMC